MVETILDILEKSDKKLSNEQIAQMIGTSEKEVADIIKGLEKENVIVGYKTMINWEKTDKELVTSIIELKVSPQRGEGFDRVAEKIYKYSQVKSLFLMSGTYDLCVIIDGASMKDVALFVAQKLAPMDNVLSTSTSFVLKKYKEDGLTFIKDEEDSRQVITL